MLTQIYSQGNTDNMTNTFWNTEKEIELFADCEKYFDNDDDPFCAHPKDIEIDTVKAKSDAVSSFGGSIVEQLGNQLPKAPFAHLRHAERCNMGETNKAKECFSDNLFEDCLMFQNNSWEFDFEQSVENEQNEMNLKIDESSERQAFEPCEVAEDKENGCSFKQMDIESKTTTEKESSLFSDSPRKCRKSSPKPLALRADVMNKNVFRALRRECKNIFEEYLKDHNMSLCKSKRTFLVNLDKFVEAILEAKPALRNMIDFDANEFRQYIGILVNTCMMKKCLTGQKETSKIAEVSDILYSYSHKKFYEFLEIKEVKIVLEIVLEHSGITGFVENHDTLVANKEAYTQHISKIF